MTSNVDNHFSKDLPAAAASAQPERAAPSNPVTPVAVNAISGQQHLPATPLPMICYYNPADPAYIKHLIAQYTRVLETNPRNINALLNRGAQYFRLKDYDKAKADYAIVLTIDKTNYDAWSGLGAVDYYKGNLAQAEFKYNLALKSQPLSYLCNMNLATICLRLGKCEQALAFLQTAEKCPHCNITAIIRARIKCYQQLDKCNDALDCLNTLLDEFPKDNQLKMDKADLLVKMNCPWSAMLTYECARKANPGNVQVYLQLGYLYEIMEDHQKAVEELEKGLAIEPANEQLLFMRALNTFLSSCDADYGKHLCALKKAHPNSPKITLLKGIEKFFGRHNTEAYQLFKEYHAKVPNDFLALLYMGQCYLDQAQYKEALTCYNKCIEVNPHDYRAYLERADIYIKMSLFDKAKADLQHCTRYIDLENDDDDDRDCVISIKAFCRLSYVYTIAADKDEGAFILDTLTDFGKEIPLVDAAYGKHLMALGKYQEAFDKFESAAEEDGWHDEEMVMAMILCKRKLGTLNDLEEAQTLLKHLQEIGTNTLEVQIIKKNIQDEIKAAKAKNLSPKASSSNPKKLNQRKPAPRREKISDKRRDTIPHNNQPENEQAESEEDVKRRQEEREAHLRIYREEQEKEKKRLALEKKREAEQKAMFKEIAQKQRENRFLSTGLRSSSVSRSKDKSLTTDFQRQKQQWLKEEQKAIKESAAEPSPAPEQGPILPPALPVVTVVRNILHPSNSPVRNFVPEAMKPIAEVYIKQPLDAQAPAAAESSKKIDKAPKKNEKVILMEPAHFPPLTSAFEALSSIESLLNMRASNESDKHLIERALLFNLRKLFGSLRTWHKSDREFVDLMNKKVASTLQLNKLGDQAASLQILGSLKQVEPFCRQLMGTGLLENLHGIHRLRAWPQHATAVSLDRLDIRPQLFPLNDKILLNYLNAECQILSQLSMAMNQPYFRDAFLMSLAAISQILDGIKDPNLVKEIAALINVQAFQAFNGNHFSLVQADQVCQRIIQKQDDLRQLTAVHTLVEFD